MILVTLAGINLVKVYIMPPMLRFKVYYSYTHLSISPIDQGNSQTKVGPTSVKQCIDKSRLPSFNCIQSLQPMTKHPDQKTDTYIDALKQTKEAEHK